MRGRALPLLASSLLTFGLLAHVSPAEAAIMTLQNDGFVAGDFASYQVGFESGESAAATLGPVNESFAINKVMFLFGGSTDVVTVKLNIYQDTGGAQPGPELFTGDYQVTGSNEAMHEIDLTADNVQVAGGGSIRVSFQLQHNFAPGVASDTDGMNAGRNWIDAVGLGWVDASILGVSGDWVIRAEVDTQGGAGGSSASGTGGSSSGTGGSSSGSGGSSSGSGGSSSGSGGSGSQVCAPGQSAECTGPGGCVGGQVCSADGSGWEPCECGAAEDESGDDGGCGCGLPGASQRDSWRFAASMMTAFLVFGAWRRRRR